MVIKRIDYSMLENSYIKDKNNNKGIVSKYENDKIFVKYDSNEELVEYSLNDIKEGIIVFDDDEIENAALLKIRLDESNTTKSALVSDKKEKEDDNYQETVLEQWRVTVESAMNVSSRRQSTNSLFITVLTILISGVLFGERLFDTNEILMFRVFKIVSVLGLFICYEWCAQIDFYSKLNDFKYAAIRDMETKLPVKVFTSEDVYFYSNYLKKKSFSKREKRIPIAFGVTFIVIMLWATCATLCHKAPDAVTTTTQSESSSSNITSSSFATTAITSETAATTEVSQ